MPNITIENKQLTTVQKEKVVELYIDGFEDVLTFIKGGRDKQIEFFSGDSIDFSTIYVALHENDVIGFMGVSNNKKRCISFDHIEKFEQMYGVKRGSAVQKKVNNVMDKPAVNGDKDLYIEYLVTDKNYRCKGVATKLINFAFEQLECDEYHIAVLSKNINAIRLYKSLGFVVWKKDYKFLSIILGFGYPVKLIKHRK